MLCRPYGGHYFPVWLDCTLLTIYLKVGDNYGTFLVEWWTINIFKKGTKNTYCKEVLDYVMNTGNYSSLENQCQYRVLLI